MSTLVSDSTEYLAKDAIRTIPVYDPSAVVRVSNVSTSGRKWSYEENKYLLELWEEIGRKGGKGPWTTIQIMWQERVESQGYPERNIAQLKCRLRRMTGEKASGKTKSEKRNICHACWQPCRGHVCTGIRLNKQQMQDCPSVITPVDADMTSENSMYEAFSNAFDLLLTYSDVCELDCQQSEFDNALLTGDIVGEWLHANILETDV